MAVHQRSPRNIRANETNTLSGIVRLNQYGRLFRSNPFTDWANLYVWLAFAKHQQSKPARDPLKKYSK